MFLISPYRKKVACLLIGSLIFSTGIILAQVSDTTLLKGQIFESGSGQPLEEVIVSVSSTGEMTSTTNEGYFELVVPDLRQQITVTMPGYTTRTFYLSGNNNISVFLVESGFYSPDDIYVMPLEAKALREVTGPVSAVSGDAISKMPGNSSDGLLQGQLAGLHVVRHSGFPGSKTWMSLGGISSIYAKSEPLLIIDGMIHEYNYADQGVIDGFTFNPWDVIDAADIVNVTALKGNQAVWGSNGSNGVIYVNTEERGETSSRIAFSAYGGVGMLPGKLNLLNSSQFRPYIRDQFVAAGLDPAGFSWLSGDMSNDEYYRYNNDTDWQDELYRPSSMQKYHIFIKGGDDVATYNLSTGYLKHESVYEGSSYSRYNLRINGKINITDRFAVVPNVKLSLSDSYLASMGPDDYKNPITSALLKSPLMAPNVRDPFSGAVLNEIDDVGVFNVSNPIAIINEGMGSNRNYHFLSSIDFRYRISPKLMISSLAGLSYNNSRESLFVPDHGLVNQEFADNSRHDLVYDFRSTQSFSRITYNENVLGGKMEGILGLRYLKNSYKYNEGNDLNTASDDFRNLGQGAKYQYLRTTLGDDRELIWASVYGVLNYSYADKYYLNASIVYDGNSNVNESNRYNLYPSAGVAWRITSEPFLSAIQRITDIKLRASYGISGNMHSLAYDYSKLYYVGRRLGESGVLVRDAVPNIDLEIEKKSTLNIGLDVNLASGNSSFVINYYLSAVNNMMMNQQLPAFGFPNYYDNGGVLNINAFEFGYNGRSHFSELIWTYGFTVSRYKDKILELKFLEDSKTSIIHEVENISDLRVEYISTENDGLNMFYGYKTEGLFQNDEEAQQYTGPGGIPMKAGDVRFVDRNQDFVINGEDKMIIGNPNPDLYGGFHTSLIYRKLELSAFFSYSYGNEIFNYVRKKTEGMDAFYNQLNSIVNRWEGPGNQSDIPTPAYGDPAGNNVFSDRWLEDGSYLRLRDLTLSYTLSLEGTMKREMDIYLTASNLLTLTKYTGYDPEVFYFNSPFNMGIDYGVIPHVRTFLIGIKLSL